MNQTEQIPNTPLLRSYRNNANCATYGYIHDPDMPLQMTVDETAAAYVRYIFQHFLDGESPSKIAADLTDMGAPTPSMRRNDVGINQSYICRQWHRSTVTFILQNRMYLGELIYRLPRVSKGLEKEALAQSPLHTGDIIHNHHEPLITHEDFDRAAALLPNLSHTPRSGEHTPRKNLTPFARSLFCGVCGHPMTGGSFKPYVCGNRDCTTKELCPPVKHPLTELTASVIAAVIAERDQARHISQLLTKGYKGEEYCKAEAAIREKVLLALDATLQAGESPASCTEQLMTLQKEKNRLLDTFTEPNKWITLFQDIPDDFEFDRELSKKLIQRIDVFPDKSIRILFQRNSEKTVLMDYLRELHVID
ncbi:MAG: recombinase family protein [Lachnospiraceae bacterium]|nr:recombinase family protein [Lachnospiraceae bacterium]